MNRVHRIENGLKIDMIKIYFNYIKGISLYFSNILVYLCGSCEISSLNTNKFCKLLL